jgi:glycosyltransferase involved in cell wall biosynthesis
MTHDVELSVTKEERATQVEGPYFAPGSEAESEQGILYQGDYQHDGDGTAIAIRLNARALAAQQVPVLLKPFSATVLRNGVFEALHINGVSDEVRAEVGGLTNTSVSRLFPLIHHFVVHKHEHIATRLMRGAVGGLDNPEVIANARKVVYGNSVLYSVWERDRIPTQMVRELNRLGDNWVPCEQNAKMLRDSGVREEKVFVVPHPYDPANPMLHLTRRKAFSNKRFYFIGRWEPRKNPVEIIWAFATAFEPGGTERLTMKFHGAWENYPSFEETIDAVVAAGKWTRPQLLAQITPIDRHLRADHIMKLHFENNIYLAPSAGEAWCLPAFDAKLAGNTLIHTPYGGTADFADKNTDLELAFQLEDVPDSYGWPAGSQWAGIMGGHLASLLRRVPVPAEFRRPDDFLRFSLDNVGKLMVDRLRKVWGEQVKW